MAGAAVVALSPAPLHLHTPPPPPKNRQLISLLPIIYQHNRITNHYDRRFVICHSKFSDAVREESEHIKEAIFGSDESMEDYVSDDDGEEDTESSIDLLFRFLQSMFKKVSKRARKASRAILPDVISPQLVSFGVDGVLLLASLSILKALLEVICTLGGTVFVVILLLRVMWSAVSFFQLSGTSSNQSGTSYGRTQPVT